MTFKKTKHEEEVEEMEEIKEDIKKEPEAEVCEVPTSMTLAFKTESGEIVSQAEFLMKLYNKLLLIEKAVV